MLALSCYISPRGARQFHFIFFRLSDVFSFVFLSFFFINCRDIFKIFFRLSDLFSFVFLSIFFSIYFRECVFRACCVLYDAMALHRLQCLTLLEPQSRFGDKPLKCQVFCPQNGTAVLKGLEYNNVVYPVSQFFHRKACIFLVLKNRHGHWLCWVPKGRKNDLILLALQARFGDKPVNFQVVCPQNGTAPLKGLM